MAHWHFQEWNEAAEVKSSLGLGLRWCNTVLWASVKSMKPSDVPDRCDVNWRQGNQPYIAALKFITCLWHTGFFSTVENEKWMHDFVTSDWTKQINKRVKFCSAELRIIWSDQMFMHYMATSLTNRWIVTLLYNPEMGLYQFEEISAPMRRRSAFHSNISMVALISVLIDYGWASGQCRRVFWSLCSSREHLTACVHH